MSLVATPASRSGRRTGIFDALRLPTAWQPWTAGFVALMAVALALVLLTYDDYGVTWDEHVQNEYGKMVLNYYLSGFRDKSALSYYDLWAYGGFFDSIAAAVNLVSPLGEYETRHLLNALCGLLGVVGCWKLARELAGERAAFWSAALLLSIPTWYGHMFNNPKDVPFAVFFVWSLYYMVRMVPLLPRPPLSLAVRLGLMIGLSLGVRVGGLLLFGFLGLLGLAFITLRYQVSRDLVAAGRDLGFGTLFVVLPVLVVAYAVMLLFWPWAQAAPFANPLDALAHFQNLPFHIQVKFFGHYFVSTETPWYYLPVELAFRLPEILLPFVLFAVGCALASLYRWRTALPSRVVLGYGLLGLAILFPLLYAVATRANLFDGMRHFTFLLPSLAVAGGTGLDRLLQLETRKATRGVTLLLIAGFFAYHLSIMVRLHPDQYVYYNRYAGGIKSAAQGFELDYWANSFAEAVDVLESDLRTEYGPTFDAHHFKVKVCDSPFSAAYYFPKNFELTDSDLQADFYIAFTRYGCDKKLQGHPLYRVERMGALLAVVMDRRELKSATTLAHR